MTTTFIAGFPGVGKSRFANCDYAPEHFAADSDSSAWSKQEGFPDNYLDYLESLRGKYGYVLISTHKLVREGLVKRGIPFVLVYPDKSLRNEYHDRYVGRNSPEALVNTIDMNWDNWLDELSQQTGCTHIVLKSGQHLSNIHLPR